MRDLADSKYTEDDKSEGIIPPDKDVGDVKVIGLKNQAIAKIKGQAGGLLQSSDWYVTRKAEAGTAAATSQQMEEKLNKLYNSILPLLSNLKKNPEKEYIYWPNRVAKVEQFEDLISGIIK